MIDGLLTLLLAGISADSSLVVLGAKFEFASAWEPAVDAGRADLGVFETYSDNWYARRLDPEAARRWEDLPAMGRVDLRAAFDSVRLFSSLPVRRDVDAWRRDPSGRNLFVSPDELDINVPYEGWLSWSGSSGAKIKVGRFRQSFSPSPYGVILGNDIVHDGIHFRIPMGRWSFDWFLSSLNPWLSGIDAEGRMDPASETSLQRTRTVTNQRGRTYSDPYKTLLLHRLGCRLGQVELAIAEQLIVGGKAPQWRDLVPFVVWHDNYGDGYSKVSTALEAVWSTAGAGRFHAQGVFEDVQVPVGEVEGADPRVVYGANFGWMRGWEGAGRWKAAVDLSITSATFNNHRIPLLKGVSRRLYRSNNRKQEEPGFVDTWVVDQPLGYRRGSDAVDLWTSVSWNAADSAYGAVLEVDWLNRGDAAVWKDGELYRNRRGPLSGNPTTEYRILPGGWIALPLGLRVDAHAGVVLVDRPGDRNPDAIPDLGISGSVGF